MASDIYPSAGVLATVIVGVVSTSVSSLSAVVISIISTFGIYVWDGCLDRGRWEEHDRCLNQVY